MKQLNFTAKIFLKNFHSFNNKEEAKRHFPYFRQAAKSGAIRKVL
jgi:dienelactone hydrolase